MPEIADHRVRASYLHGFRLILRVAWGYFIGGGLVGILSLYSLKSEREAKPLL